MFSIKIVGSAGRHQTYIRPQEQLRTHHQMNRQVVQRMSHLLLEPPTRPAASCSFRFCPPDKLLALEYALASKSQSRNNCIKSSLLSVFSDHLTACQTRRFCIHVNSGKRMFFCGTRPMVPRGGLRFPPSKTTFPLLLLLKPPIIDKAVDFPALFMLIPAISNPVRSVPV